MGTRGRTINRKRNTTERPVTGGARSQQTSRQSKSKQAHFWVDAALADSFYKTAKAVGMELPDAHRAAMQCFIDQNALEGSAFLYESIISIGQNRINLRAFASRGDQFVLQASGLSIRKLISTLLRSDSPTDLSDCLRRLSSLLVQRTSSRSKHFGTNRRGNGGF